MTHHIKEPKLIPGGEPINASDVLNALNTVVVIVDADAKIAHVNTAGEHFFCSGASSLITQALQSFIPEDSPVFSLISQVREKAIIVSEYGISLDSPRIGRHYVNIQAVPLIERDGHVVLTIQERSIADKIDRQLTHRGAARSVSAMASMLAHEVKNPLSGIRGAAQLLETNASPDDKMLTRLICDETDRICALIDRMDVFSDGASSMREPVNIHQVLDRVHQLGRAGFASHSRFTEIYDPSLPHVLGNRDQLVQVFLNLVKNAAEAAPREGSRIVLTTAYRQGVRFAIPGVEKRVHLPLMVSVENNGDEIPEDMRAHLFDPFVTSKPKGSGLGLALVAKIINDHGGVIEFESQPRRTVFRVMLPVASEMET